MHTTGGVDPKVVTADFDPKFPHCWIVFVRNERTVCDVCVSGDLLAIQIRHLAWLAPYKTTIPLGHPDSIEQVIALLKRHGF